MSMREVRSYFEVIANSLSFKEMDEAFEDQAIAAGVSNRYFIKLGNPTLQEQDHRTATFKAQVTVELFVGRSIKTIDIQSKTFAAAEEFFALAMSRRAEANFAKISLLNYSVEPIANSNDTTPIAKMDFETTYVIGF